MPGNKSQFLSKLSSSIAGKEYVNFNYAGHGMRLPSGEWALALPGLLTALETCKSWDKKGFDPIQRPRYLHPKLPAAAMKCPGVKDLIVTSSELRNVFAGKKVFGFNDSCTSGALDLGKDSQMINATQGNEFDYENHPLTSFLKKKSSAKDCSLHTDADGAASYSEILRMFPHEEGGSDGLTGLNARWGHINQMGDTKQIHTENGGTKTVGGNYTQIPTRTGALTTSWSSCMKMVLPGNQCGGGSPAPEANAPGAEDTIQ